MWLEWKATSLVLTFRAKIPFSFKDSTNVRTSILLPVIVTDLAALSQAGLTPGGQQSRDSSHERPASGKIHIAHPHREFCLNAIGIIWARWILSIALSEVRAVGSKNIIGIASTNNALWQAVVATVHTMTCPHPYTDIETMLGRTAKDVLKLIFETQRYSEISKTPRYSAISVTLW